MRNQGTQSTAIVGQIILSSSFTYKNFYYVFFSPISNEITTILRNNKENELHYLNFRFVKQFEFLWFKESLQNCIHVSTTSKLTRIFCLFNEVIVLHNPYHSKTHSKAYKVYLLNSLIYKTLTLR